MTHRWFAVAILAVALVTGCRSAPARRSFAAAHASAPAPDPYRWERAACDLGEYPAELDARALARARHQDLRARRNGTPGSFSAAQLESERDGFAARCAVWRAEAARDGAWASTARVP
jgi:hypothetical protein